MGYSFKSYFLSAVLTGMLAVPVTAGAQDSPDAGYDGKAFLEQLQPRDSVLIADQLRYGFELDGVKEGTDFLFPDYSKGFCEGVEVVSPWILDTVDVRKGRKKAPSLMDIKGSVTITSFDEGRYELPPIYIVRVTPEGIADTLAFSPEVLEVRTMPVDTATFKIHDIKGQIQYPVEFREVLPYLAGAVALALIVLLAIYLTRKCQEGTCTYYCLEEAGQAARGFVLGSGKTEGILFRHYRCAQGVHSVQIRCSCHGDDYERDIRRAQGQGYPPGSV